MRAQASRAGFSMLETVIAPAVPSLTAAIVSTRAFASGADTAATTAALPIPVSWSFGTDTPLVARADGLCADGVVELLRGERVRARLTPAGHACRYLRAS